MKKKEKKFAGWIVFFNALTKYVKFFRWTRRKNPTITNVLVTTHLYLYVRI